MIRTITTFAIATLTSLIGSTTVAGDSFYVDYSAHPNPDHLLAYDLNVIHPSADADLAAGQNLGNRYLAYVSVVEIAADAPYRDAAKNAGIKTIVKNEIWNSDVADPSNPAWRAFVINSLARPAVEKGFDGFMLDTVDSISLIATNFPDQAEADRKIPCD